MCNYFKPTDRDAYVPLESCHHSFWLCNIPRGQFIRLKGNCTRKEDFISQSQVLSSRFQQKEYDKNTLDGEIERVRIMGRHVLVSNLNRECKNDVNNFKMTLDYNVQYKKFEKIVLKN